MLRWFSLFLDDPPAAESRLLRELLKESPEIPDWSAAVQPVLHRLLDGGPVKRPIVCRVLDMPALNAFALPHKTVVVSQLLVEFLRERVDLVSVHLAQDSGNMYT